MKQGYTTQDRRYADTVDEIVLAPLDARVGASGTGEAYELGDRATLRVVATVTAKTGTSPTLDLTVQTSRDGVTWYTAGTFAQFDDPDVSSPVLARQCFAIDRFVRLSWAIGGSSTPGLTFGAIAEAA
jgi:hypothetical protein